jgi:broad specificity phosphatase PhoE
MDLILIRHGQSQYNFDQTGGWDAPLTALGRMQARRAGLYCKTQFQLSALYASTYSRAQETAQIINSYVGLDCINYMDDLREFSVDYGFDLTRFEVPTDALDLPELVPPTAISEYYVSFHERVVRALRVILTAHQDLYSTPAQIGVVSHGGTMGTMLRSLAGSHHFSLNTENTGIHILRWEEQRWHVVALNRTEHLECERWHHAEGKDA